MEDLDNFPRESVFPAALEKLLRIIINAFNIKKILIGQNLIVNKIHVYQKINYFIKIFNYMMKL